MTCLDDRRLLDLHLGDGSDAERRHVSGCEACAARKATLARDLARIDAVLGATTPPRRAPARIPAWSWAPVALAAALVLAVALGRHGAQPVASSDDDGTLALADELASAVATTVSFDDGGASPSAATARSTCTWGDPLLGVGCDEPAVMQIAWR